MAAKVIQPNLVKTRRFFETLVLFAALMVIPMVLIEEFASDPEWLRTATLINWGIWIVFLSEYLVMLWIVPARWYYTRRAWLDVAIIVLTFPALPVLLATLRLARIARLARVLRLLRFLKLAAVLARAGFALRTVMLKRGVAYLTSLSLLLAAGFGTLYFLAERPEIGSVWDGIWWAFVTLSTVGYGDIYPKTGVGRMLAVVLMFVGIGFVATLTAAIAAHFIEQEEEQVIVELRRIGERLERIESRLAETGSEPEE